MRALSIKNQIRSFLVEWEKQYSGRDPKEFVYSLDPLAKARTVQEVRDQIAEVDLESALPSDVEKLTGNTSWACPKHCHECGKVSSLVIEMGNEDDIKERRSQFCLSCLRKAVRILLEVPKADLFLDECGMRDPRDVPEG